MKELNEVSLKEHASFWLNAVLSQFGKEVQELAKGGTESHGEPVATHFLLILDIWRQSKEAFDKGSYDRALRMTQAIKLAMDEIDYMKSRYPYQDQTKEPVACSVKAVSAMSFGRSLCN
jgi:hypothetical protein